MKSQLPMFSRLNKATPRLRSAMLVSVGILVMAGYGFAFTIAEAAPGINKTINFQGKLVGNTGLNVADSSYSVVFTLYDASSGGTNLWDETQTVSTTDGMFQVALGSVDTTLGDVDFNSDSIYLGIKVGADLEMTPRIRFSAVPYALNAQKVAGLTVTNTTGTLTIPNGKTISFGDAFTTSGSNPLTLTTTGTTNITLPTTGTLLTNTASANQTVTSTQTSGTIFSILDATGLSGNITGQAITLSGSGAHDQTGLSFNLSGASGSNLNDIVGTGSSWKVSRDGVLSVASCTGCGGGTNYWRLDQGAFSLVNDTADLLLGGISSSSAKFKVSPSGTSPTASVSGQTSSAALVVDNSGIGDLFTASASGRARFTVKNDGTFIVGADGNVQSDVTIRGGAASGTNVAGSNIFFDASNGTGNGGSGDFIFRTAASGSGGIEDAWCNDVTDILCSSSWQYRKKITFNNAASSEDLVNFPVLVKIPSTLIDDSKTQDDGDDLRFVDPTDPTAVLPHEIETWNESGDSYVWVKVPQINQLSTTDYILMYYGNAGATSGQDGDNVWDSNYAMVQHLDQTAGTHFDSTANNNDSTAISVTTQGSATGKINGADAFNGTTSQVNVGSGNSLDNVRTLTYSAWINPTTFGEGSLGRILDKGTTGGEGGPGFYVCNATCINTLRFYQEFDSTPGQWSAPNSLIATGTLTHVAVTYNGNATTNDPTFYVNGVAYAPAVEVNAPVGTASLDDSWDMRIGNRQANDRTFDGVIDETRVSNVIRSADWIEAEYISGSDAMNSFGDEDQYGAGGPYTNTLTERLRIASNGQVGINAGTLLADFDVRGLSTSMATASISGQTSSATLVVVNNGLGDLFTASKSGASKFTVKNDGTIALDDTHYNDCGSLVTDSTGLLTCGGPGGSASGADLAQGATTLTDTTLAGTATLIGTVSVTPTTSTGDILVQAQLWSKSLSNTDQTVTWQLRSGSNCSGSILDTRTSLLTSASGNNGPAGFLTYVDANAGTSAKTYAICGSSGTASGVSAGGLATATVIDSAGLMPGEGTSYLRIVNGAFSTINDTADFLIGGESSTSAVFKISPNGTSPTASISGRTANAAMIVDNAGIGDLFTASKSGKTHFVINNAGNVGIGTNTPAANLHVQSTNPEQLRLAYDATNYTSFQQKNNGDLVITPSNGAAVYFGAYSLQNSVYLDQTGAIRSNSATHSSYTGTGNLGVGTDTPQAKLDVRGTSGTIPVASVSGQTAHAAMIVDNNGVGDLFTASKSGATKFTVTNSGTVGIGQFPRTANGNSPSGSLHLWGPGVTGSQAVMYFGDVTVNSNAYIKEAGTGDSDQLELGGKSGLIFATGTNTSYGFERMRIDTNGNVGIGTQSPTTKLHVDGFVTGKALSIFNETGDQNIFTASSSGLNVFQVGRIPAAGASGNFLNLNPGLTAMNGSDIVRGLYVDFTNANHTGTTNELIGIDIDSITGDAEALEAGLRVGTGWDTDIDLDDTTSNIRLGATDNTATFTIGDSSTTAGAHLLEIKDLSTAFGAVVSAGAFISHNSYHGEEFGLDRASLANDQPDLGDYGIWYGDGNAATACTWAGLDTPPGFVRFSTVTNGAGCLMGFGTATGNLSTIFDADSNLPVVQYKMRTSVVPGTTYDIRGGLMDKAASTTTDTAPTNGVYFSNNNANSWVGTIKNGATTGTTAACSSMVANQFALFRIEVLSTTQARFLIDNNAGDGVQWTDCGTVSTAGAMPTGSLGAAVDLTQTTTTVNNIDVDYFRVWQDDNAEALEPLVDESGLNFETENMSTVEMADSALTLEQVNETIEQNIGGQEAEITPETLLAGLILVGSEVTELEDKVASLEAKMSNASATLTPTTAATSSALASAELVTDNLSTTANATVSGSLRVQGNALIEGILNVVDSLTVGNFIVNNLATFFADAIFKGDVFFQGTTYFSADTAGYVTIHAGTKEAEVKFTKQYKEEPVINTSVVTSSLSDEQFNELKETGECEDDQPKSDCEAAITREALEESMPYVIGARSKEGFMIKLAEPAIRDLQFAWTAISVRKEEQ